jgi:hypothetical protein
VNRKIADLDIDSVVSHNSRAYNALGILSIEGEKRRLFGYDPGSAI